MSLSNKKSKCWSPFKSVCHLPGPHIYMYLHFPPLPSLPRLPLNNTAGPFRYLDSYGADKMLDNILRFRETFGDHIEPAQLLRDYAKEPSRKFHVK